MKKYFFLVVIVSIFFFQKNYSEGKVSKIDDWDDLMMHYQSFCVYESEWFTCASKGAVIDVIVNIQSEKLINMVNDSSYDIFELLYVLKSEGADWRIIKILKNRGYKFPQILFGCNTSDAVKIIGDERLADVIEGINFKDSGFNCDHKKLNEYFRIKEIKGDGGIKY